MIAYLVIAIFVILIFTTCNFRISKLQFQTYFNNETDNDNTNNKKNIIIYFQIQNNVVNTTIAIPAFIDFHIHYDRKNHSSICFDYHLDSIICEYLLYKIYEVFYTVLLNTTNIDKENHHKTEILPKLSESLYRNVYIPIPKYQESIKSELYRLYHSNVINNKLIHNEETIFQNLISYFKYKPHSKICIIHSATIIKDNDYIINDILQHIIKSNLINKLDVLIILNYGFEIAPLRINDTLITTIYHNILYYQVSNDSSYFEVPSLRILYRLSHYFMSVTYPIDNIDTHVLYLHTKGASYQEVHSHIELWRSTMLYYLVDKHEKSNHLLLSQEFDTVGIYYVNSSPQHYMGNYWWSKISYLSKLNILKYHECGKYEPSYWLFSYNGYINAFNLHLSLHDYDVFKSSIIYNPLTFGVTYLNYTNNI